MTSLKYLIITPGDPEGIGPEVTWKALQRVRLPSHFRVLVVGSLRGFEKNKIPYFLVSSPAKSSNELNPLDESLIRQISNLPRYQRGSSIPVIGVPAQNQKSPLLSKSSLSGFESGWAVSFSVRLLLEALDPNRAALVTGPISKERLISGGFPFPGHTELLSFLSQNYSSRRKKIQKKSRSILIAPVTMMLANELFRVSLVTTHIPLSQVSKRVTEREILRAARHTYSFVKNQMRAAAPRIAVLGLNPHAGESGILGSEEIRIISPAIKKLNRLVSGNVFSGPYPADTYFAIQASYPKSRRHDAVVAMYHDQGLIPAKLVNFDRTVNITLGLPFLRTSVDHGTAFDIAGKNVANPDSMISALEQASQFLDSAPIF